MKPATQVVERKRLDSMNISQITVFSRLDCQLYPKLVIESVDEHRKSNILYLEVEVCGLQASVCNRTSIYLKVLGRDVDHQTPVFQTSSELTPSWFVSIEL